MQDNVEEVLVLLRKLIGELQKELGQIYLKSLLQRLGKLLVDAKSSKHLQKMWQQKQFGYNWEVETRNQSVEPDPFLEKIDRKTVALAKNFLTI